MAPQTFLATAAFGGQENLLFLVYFAGPKRSKLSCLRRKMGALVYGLCRAEGARNVCY